MSSEIPTDLLRERRVFALLAELCELEPEAQQRELEACDDPDLAAEVRRKLAARESVALQLESPLPGEPEPRPIQIGDRVGPFEIVGLLGEGGMGQVFHAVQRQPVRREVALKIMRLGRLQVEAKVRFDAERRAMARLDHPNIGRILEAGTTDIGQPYFAMELIDGAPVTSYCDRVGLSIKERLRLFLQICRGTQHAHLKLLLHRDLKPSNVLVTEVDGQPVPKIIDFGIAKGLGSPLVTEAAVTGDGFLGTPAYMSPEALESGEEVDARSDVFSLGVLLYELLTGSLPWGVATERNPLQWLKRRLERDADRPSTQVTDLDEERRSEVAERRRLDGDGLAKRLRGDLDSLVMKAIEPEPGRRYESAAELADDIERHLASEPILARPLTTGVLLRKLIRRHRLTVIAGVVVALALVVGSIGTALGLLRAQRAEREALVAKDLAIAEARAAEEAREEAEEARDEAEEARDESKEVADFLIGVFAASNPEKLDSDKSPAEISALELLDRGAQRIETDLADRPAIRARIELTIGFLYGNLGEPARALELIRSSVATLDADDSPSPFQVAQALVYLADEELGAGDRAASARHLERALGLLETQSDERAKGLRAQTLDTLGRQRIRVGDFAGAEEIFLEAVVAFGDLGKEPAVANVHHNLGSVYLQTGRFREAEAQFRRAYEIYEPLVESGHPTLAGFTMGIAGSVASQGRLEEAAELFESAERVIRQRRGEDHPSRATALLNLGMLNRDLHRFDQAEGYFRQALEIRERALGGDHPLVGQGLNYLAWTLSDLGRDDEARPLQERALPILETTLGAEHPQLAQSLEHLAALALRRGEFGQARGYARRAYEILAARPATGDAGVDPDLGRAACELAEALWHLGRREEARRRFDEARAIFEAGGESTLELIEELDARLARLGAAS